MRNFVLACTSAALFASVATAQEQAPEQAPEQAKPAQPGPAAATANWAPGAKVSDTEGGAVGLVTEVEGGFVVIKTDKHEVRLPRTSFAPRGNGLVIALTQAQVNAEVEKVLAEAGGKSAPGAASDQKSAPGKAGD